MVRLEEVTAAVSAAAKHKGASDDVVRAVTDVVEQKFPKRTYEVGVWFLGFAALILVLAGVVAMFLDKQAPEPLWVTVGVAVGALAGIFRG